MRLAFRIDPCFLEADRGPLLVPLEDKAIRQNQCLTLRGGGPRTAAASLVSSTSPRRCGSAEIGRWAAEDAHGAMRGHRGFGGCRRGGTSAAQPPARADGACPSLRTRLRGGGPDGRVGG